MYCHVYLGAGSRQQFTIAESAIMVLYYPHFLSSFSYTPEPLFYSRKQTKQKSDGKKGLRELYHFLQQCHLKLNYQQLLLQAEIIRISVTRDHLAILEAG